MRERDHIWSGNNGYAIMVIYQLLNDSGTLYMHKKDGIAMCETRVDRLCHLEHVPKLQDTTRRLVGCLAAGWLLAVWLVAIKKRM